MQDSSNNSDRLFARRLTRNVAAGTIVMYGVSVAICIPGVSLSMAAGAAVLPAVFAGPFVGGLLTTVMAQRQSDPAEGTDEVVATPVIPAAVIAPAA